MRKACTFIILITDSYHDKAKEELDEAIELHIKRLRHWKKEKATTSKM